MQIYGENIMGIYNINCQSNVRFVLIFCCCRCRLYVLCMCALLCDMLFSRIAFSIINFMFAFVCEYKIPSRLALLYTL